MSYQHTGELTKLIQTFGELASTPEGALWVMKVLNPAFNGIPQGIPDRNTTETVMYNFEGIISVEAGSVTGALPNDLVNYQINCYMHPTVFADILVSTTSQPNNIENCRTFLNPQLPNATVYPALPGTVWGDKVVKTTADMQAKNAYWMSQCQHARPIFGSFTLDASASSDNDQGTICCVQQDQTPRETVVLDSKNGEFIQQKYYGPEDFATFENSQSMNRAYNGPLREGVYTVCKLNEVPETYVNQTSPVSLVSHTIGGTVAGTSSEASPHLFIAIKNGTPNIPIMSNYCAQIFIRGASPLTSFTLRYRMGFEVKPFVGSPNTVFAKNSPAYDELAMKMYSRLMLEVQKDGYPANYNMFGWLGNIIRKAAPYVKRAVVGGIQGLASGEGLAGALQGAAGGFMDEMEEQKKRQEEREFAKGAKRVRFVED